MYIYDVNEMTHTTQNTLLLPIGFHVLRIEEYDACMSEFLFQLYFPIFSQAIPRMLAYVATDLAI